jgi:carbohydrate-selective porin OprB
MKTIINTFFYSLKRLALRNRDLLHLPVFRSCVLWLAALFAVAPMCAQQETLYHQQHTAGPLSKWIEGDRGLSDLGGIRNILSDHGLEFFGGYTAEVWGNTTGGIKRGTVYTGLLDFGANLDFEKMVGGKGASFSTTWLWFWPRRIRGSRWQLPDRLEHRRIQHAAHA